MTRALALALMFSIASTAASASAQEEDARWLFDQGVEHADEERWGEAVEFFRRSWALDERAVTAFNLAGALLRLGRPNGTLDALQEYLRLATEDDSRREAARELSELALAAIAHVDLTVAPPGATLRIDGELAAGDGPGRELRLDPGAHLLRLEADGYVGQSVTVSLLAGERASRSIELEPLSEPVGPAHLRITSDRASAVILVDDAVVGRGTYVTELEPGVHTIEVRADGFESFRRTFELAPAERRDVQAALTPVASTPFAEEPALWITISALVVGGLVGGIAAAAASGEDAPYGGSTDVVIFGLSGAF